MGKVNAKIETYTPADKEKGFKYPKNAEIKEKDLTEKLIKALRDGLGDNLPLDK